MLYLQLCAFFNIEKKNGVLRKLQFNDRFRGHNITTVVLFVLFNYNFFVFKFLYLFCPAYVCISVSLCDNLWFAHNLTQWMIHFETIQVLYKCLRLYVFFSRSMCKTTQYQHITNTCTCVYAYGFMYSSKKMIYSMCAHPSHSFFIDQKIEASIKQRTKIRRKRWKKKKLFLIFWTIFIIKITTCIHVRGTSACAWWCTIILCRYTHTNYKIIQKRFVMRLLLFDYSWRNVCDHQNKGHKRTFTWAKISTNNDGDDESSHLEISHRTICMNDCTCVYVSVCVRFSFR